VSRYSASQLDLGVTADLLTAFFNGGDERDARAGALVLADAIDSLRAVRSFLTQKPRRRGG
jgi:hypothetical protein